MDNIVKKLSFLGNIPDFAMNEKTRLSMIKIPSHAQSFGEDDYNQYDKIEVITRGSEHLNKVENKEAARNIIELLNLRKKYYFFEHSECKIYLHSFRCLT